MCTYFWTVYDAGSSDDSDDSTETTSTESDLWLIAGMAVIVLGAVAAVFMVLRKRI